MAERRMFSKNVIDSDLFIDMSVSAQLLYFHLGMHADDDGFVNNPKQIQRSVGCGADDLKLLAAKGFIIPFESGVVVITHWKVHNYIPKDRYKHTNCKDENSKLQLIGNVYSLLPSCIQNVDNLDTQDRLGKDRLGKDRLSKDRLNILETAPTPNPKPTKHKYGEYENVLLTDEEYSKLKIEISDLDEFIERLSSYIASKGAKYKSHYATIRNWFNREKASKPQEKSKSGSPDYNISFSDLLKNV